MLIEMLQAITRFIFILEFITYIVRSVLVILQEKLACEFRVQESFIATKGVERPQTVHVRDLSRQWLLVNLLSRIAPSTFQIYDVIRAVRKFAISFRYGKVSCDWLILEVLTIVNFLNRSGALMKIYDSRKLFTVALFKS